MLVTVLVADWLRVLAVAVVVYVRHYRYALRTFVPRGQPGTHKVHVVAVR